MKSRGLRRVLSDFRRHPWLHFVSVTTITVALLLVGALLVVVRNVEFVAEKSNPRVTGTLYLKEGLSEDLVRELRDKVFSLESVRQVVFKDRDSVVGEIQAFLGESLKNTMPGAEAFPDVLEVELDPGLKSEAVEVVKNQLLAMGGVQDVDFSDAWLIQYKKLRRFGNFIGGAIIFALVFGCGFIIANFMGIRHQSRREEIHVARMMGAHRGFILAPFVWEGIIEGVLGATIAVLTLYIGTIMFSQVVALEWGSLMGIKRLVFLSISQLLCVVTVGVAMALVGSVMVFFRFQEPSRL